MSRWDISGVLISMDIVIHSATEAETVKCSQALIHLVSAHCAYPCSELKPEWRCRDIVIAQFPSIDNPEYYGLRSLYFAIILPLWGLSLRRLKGTVHPFTQS